MLKIRFTHLFSQLFYSLPASHTKCNNTQCNQKFAYRRQCVLYTVCPGRTGVHGAHVAKSSLIIHVYLHVVTLLTADCWSRITALQWVDLHFNSLPESMLRVEVRWRKWKYLHKLINKERYKGHNRKVAPRWLRAREIAFYKYIYIESFFVPYYKIKI